MRKENIELSTNKFTRGLRSYFFDILKSSNGAIYLKISSSKKERGSFEHHRIMIFEEDMDAFVKMMSQSVRKLDNLKRPK